ncbi:hypothetical protein SAMN04488136_13629 [Vibrio xiamenensis]|uniref:Uncharacterized protein n=1 Tax=Vibrio xiamenensis TaxID=861298 RepID=A0A1G8GEA6_9VIBR|nr:hypothetical protein [Vibrio xiamenensis]SDH92666.1 hypothetical protein SAMN04488136_13629 [Vibrio xiamenensis]
MGNKPTKPMELIALCWRRAERVDFAADIAPPKMPIREYQDECKVLGGIILKRDRFEIRHCNLNICSSNYSSYFKLLL